MADQIVHEMIAAFSVGCMDRQNFVQFKEYMQQDGELPEGEMGELQNIVAMIPIILDIEKPHPSIKDKVAKRLIEIKDEIKAKIASERKTAATSFSKTFTAPQEISEQVSFKSTKPIGQTFGTKLTNINLQQAKSSKDEFAEYLEKRKTKLQTQEGFTPAPLPPVKEDTFESIRKEPEPVSPQKPTTKIEEPIETEEVKSTSWLGILSLIISLLLFTILGYFGFTSLNKIYNSIDDLHQEINSMKSQLNAANNFVENYNALVEFFNYKDISVTNLQPVNDSLQVSAKLLLSFNEKAGLIQFKNPKQLPSGKVYQLWAIRRSQFVPMGIFQPNGSEYLRITQFPPMPKEQIDFYKVTIEKAGGAEFPSSEVVLTSK